MTILLGSLAHGGTSDSFSASDQAASRWQASASDNVATITLSGLRAGSTFTSLRFAVYAESASAPTTLLGTTDTTSDTSTADKKLTLGTPVSVTSGTFYWLALLSLGGSVLFTNDVTGQYDGSTGHAAFADPFGADAFGGGNNIPMIGESAGSTPVMTPSFSAIPFMGGH